MDRKKCISMIKDLTIRSKSQGLKTHEQNLLNSLRKWLKIKEFESIVDNLMLKSKSQGLNAYDRKLLGKLETSIEEYKEEQEKLKNQQQDGFSILELKVI